MEGNHKSAQVNVFAARRWQSPPSPARLLTRYIHEIIIFFIAVCR